MNNIIKAIDIFYKFASRPHHDFSISFEDNKKRIPTKRVEYDDDFKEKVLKKYKEKTLQNVLKALLETGDLKLGIKLLQLEGDDGNLYNEWFLRYWTEQANLSTLLFGIFYDDVKNKYPRFYNFPPISFQGD